MNPTTHPFNNIDLGGVCFVSDIHLSEHLPLTLAQFERFCQTIAPRFDTLIILGDLFEYWVGDDTSEKNPIAQRVIDTLNQLHAKGKRIGFIAGNRDFLLGDEFAAKAKLTLLPDPCVIRIQNASVLISHGDIYCTDDAAYQRFRRLVHTHWVQKLFLKSPASWRRALANHLRQKSQNRWLRQSAMGQKQLSILQDVNSASVEQSLAQYQCATLIHGHTHRPSTHLTYNTTRLVLPDWQCEHEPDYRWGYIAWPINQTTPELCVLRHITSQDQSPQ